MIGILLFLILSFISIIVTLPIVEALYPGCTVGLFSKWRVKFIPKNTKYNNYSYGKDQWVIEHAVKQPFPISYGYNSYKWKCEGYYDTEDKAREEMKRLKI